MIRLHLYKKLLEKLSITRSSLDYFALTAPDRYKIYTIPKRSSGLRVIAHPSVRLKNTQRALVAVLEDTLASHSSSFAYKKGMGIKENALQHINSRYLLKMDFSDFFNSITPEIFFNVCDSREVKLSTAERRLLGLLLFWDKRKSYKESLVLSVGAPSSPLISNFVMYDFDSVVSEFCRKNKINYSRYADDITFSTMVKGNLFEIPSFIKTQLRVLFCGLITINEAKTIFTSKAHNRHVTGVTLTNDNKLSIGRDRKRLISTLIHKYKFGLLDVDDSSYLQGLLAFSTQIEPEFRKRMELKYSPELVAKILKLRQKNDIH
jgi:retron-type reverse transcriptase